MKKRFWLIMALVLETAVWGNVEETANVETKILEPGKTAYVMGRYGSW